MAVPQVVNRCDLNVNGTIYTDFSNFTEDTRIVAMTVELMNKTSFAKKTPRYGFSIDSKVPWDNEMNLDNLENTTLTVGYDNGDTFLWSGVYTLETGSGSIDGETPLSLTKTFGAVSKVQI